MRDVRCGTWILVAWIGLCRTTDWSAAQEAIQPPPPTATESSETPGAESPSLESQEADPAAPSENVPPPDAPANDPASTKPPADVAPATETPETETPSTETPGTQSPKEADRPPAVSPEDEEYFELLKLFADTLDQVERNYVKEVSRRELMEAAIQGVLAKLDEYSDYIPPDQIDSFRTGVENEFGGIGIRVGLVDNQLTVITPLIGTPAYRAGVLAGDQIIKIGEQATQGISLEDAIGRMKGRVGSEIALTIRHRDDSQERTVTLQRELVRMETVVSDRRKPDDSWDFVFDAEQKIGYVRITSFSRHTSEDLLVAIKELNTAGVKGLVLDLRFNPGGLLSTAIEVADLFLPGGTIVSTSGRNTPSRVWSATKEGTFEDFEITVLVNRYSASASEIVAASLQDHHRGIVIGERTWGKGSVQNIIELEGGRSALKLTTAGYQRPSGKNIHRFEGATDGDDWGVRPDEGYEVSLTPSETRQLLAYQRDRDILLTPSDKDKATSPEREVDRQLQTALNYLQMRLAAPQQE